MQDDVDSILVIAASLLADDGLVSTEPGTRVERMARWIQTTFGGEIRFERAGGITRYHGGDENRFLVWRVGDAVGLEFETLPTKRLERVEMRELAALCTRAVDEAEKLEG